MSVANGTQPQDNTARSASGRAFVQAYLVISFDVRNIPDGDGENDVDEPHTTRDVIENLGKSTKTITEYRFLSSRFVVGRL